MTTNELLNWLSGYAIQLKEQDRGKLFRAVNAYDALVATLETLQEQASYAKRYQHGENLEAHQRVTEAVLTLAAEVIAKAENGGK